MDPETYCGASDEHVHFNNQKFSNGKPLKLFGIDGDDENTVWLDMKNCSGIMDSATFSLLQNMDYISFKNCNFEQCSKAFAKLDKLKSIHIEKSVFPLKSETFEDNHSITTLSLKGIDIPMHSCFQYLNYLESITFDACIIENLSKDIFLGLNSLKRLSVSNCKINTIASDTFDNIAHLEELDIRDNEIETIDFNIFTRLIKLTFFSFHDNKIKASVDYTVFEQLQSVNTIHFDLDIYKTINFDSFPHLEMVKIGYIDDADNSEANELIEKLNSKDIKTEYVFCGSIDFDSDEMEECD